MSTIRRKISSALSALPASGTLLLLAGTFRLGDKLSVPGQRVIVGQGDRTKLAGVRPTGADPLPEIVLAADEVTLRDFELTGHLQVLNSSSHIRLRNLVARNIVGDACAVFQNYAVGEKQGSQHGLHIDNAAHALVKDSVLEGNRLGVWANGSEDLVLQNVTITDPIGEIVSCGATPSCNLFGCGSYALSRSQLEPKICGCKTDCALFTENGTELVFTGRVCRAGSANPLCIPAGRKADTSGVELVSP